MHYTFFVNPAARSGKSMVVWGEVEQFLKSTGVAFDSRLSTAPGELRKWAYQYAKYEDSADRQLVVVGGDGSLNEVINGLLAFDTKRSIPLAYIPAGAGNDFARAHGITGTPVEMMQTILAKVDAGEPKSIDIGEYMDAVKRERRFFLNNVGIGFDATTVEIANNSRIKNILNKLKLGKATYGVALIEALSRQDRFPVEIIANGRKFYTPRGYLLTVSNHPYFGGGVKIMPDADPTDGKIDLIMIERPQFFMKILWLLVQLVRGRHYNYSEVHRFTAASIRVRTSRLEFGHADGEELGSRAYDLMVTTRPYPFWL